MGQFYEFILKIFTDHDILGGCGASDIKIDAQYRNRSPFHTIKKNTHKSKGVVIDCAVWIDINDDTALQLGLYHQQDSTAFTCVLSEKDFQY